MLEFEAHRYVIRDTGLDGLSEFTLQVAAALPELPDRKLIYAVSAVTLAVNAGVFSLRMPDTHATVGVLQEDGHIIVVSDDAGQDNALTVAEAVVLAAVLRREEFGVFFSAAGRYRRLRQAAAGYGL